MEGRYRASMLLARSDRLLGTSLHVKRAAVTTVPKRHGPSAGIELGENGSIYPRPKGKPHK